MWHDAHQLSDHCRGSEPLQLHPAVMSCMRMRICIAPSSGKRAQRKFRDLTKTNAYFRLSSIQGKRRPCGRYRPREHEQVDRHDLRSRRQDPNASPAYHRRWQSLRRFGVSRLPLYCTLIKTVECCNIPTMCLLSICLISTPTYGQLRNRSFQQH
jgi:hypothetical protein